MGGLAAGGYYIYRKQSSATLQQTAKDLRIKILGIHNEQSAIAMNFDIQNPNSTGLMIRAIVGDLYADGKRIAAISMFGDYLVAGARQMTIPIVAKPYKRELLISAQNLWDRGTARVYFQGSINVNNIKIPLTLNYNR